MVDCHTAVSWSLILAVASIHSLIVPARRYTEFFYQLPYSIGEGWYLQGADDALFVLGWLVLMTAIRATVIEGLYQLVTYFHLISKKNGMRFAEQGFLLLYSGTSFTVGMVGSSVRFFANIMTKIIYSAHSDELFLLA